MNQKKINNKMIGDKVYYYYTPNMPTLLTILERDGKNLLLSNGDLLPANSCVAYVEPKIKT